MELDWTVGNLQPLSADTQRTCCWISGDKELKWTHMWCEYTNKKKIKVSFGLLLLYISRVIWVNRGSREGGNEQQPLKESNRSSKSNLLVSCDNLLTTLSQVSKKTKAENSPGDGVGVCAPAAEKTAQSAAAAQTQAAGQLSMVAAGRRTEKEERWEGSLLCWRVKDSRERKKKKKKGWSAFARSDVMTHNARAHLAATLCGKKKKKKLDFSWFAAFLTRIHLHTLLCFDVNVRTFAKYANSL